MAGRKPRPQQGAGGNTPPAPPLWVLRPNGIDLPVVLPRDPALVEGMLSCINGWPFALVAMDTADTAAGAAAPARTGTPTVVEPRAQGLFRIHSRYLDQPLDGLGPAGAICAVLADLSQARCEAPGTHTFGLHCGGVTLGQRTLILAGERRAGKSTLVSRLSAEPGVTVLCYDVLPVARDGTALSLGLAPRLRLPLPPAASEAFRAHVNRWIGPSDHRYGYLRCPSLARHGHSAQADVFVLLDRRADGPARLHRLPAAETMRHIVERAISGPEGPEHTYRAARALSGRLTGLRLVYSDLEQATALLMFTFAGVASKALLPAATASGRPSRGQGGKGPVPRIHPPLVAATPGLPPAPAFAPAPQTRRYRRSPATVTRRIGASAFLWRADDPVLWQLNPVAQAVWTLLSRPQPARRLAETLAAVFPDEDPARLLADTCTLLGRMEAEGLVQAAKAKEGNARPPAP